jgi:fumarylacetoacetate (FAA) hydrolase
LERQEGRSARCGCRHGVSLGQLIAHAAKTRNLRAGAIVGSGTVSNKDAKRGYCCIAEKRCIEMIEHGAPQTEFMKYGDTVKIDMFDEAGKSIFGSIEQAVSPLEPVR